MDSRHPSDLMRIFFRCWFASLARELWHCRHDLDFFCQDADSAGVFKRINVQDGSSDPPTLAARASARFKSRRSAEREDVAHLIPLLLVDRRARLRPALAGPQRSCGQPFDAGEKAIVAERPADAFSAAQALERTRRAGPGYLNRFSASISGASAGVRLPSGVAAVASRLDRASCRQGANVGAGRCKSRSIGRSKRGHR
jgi:hypothetical protein